MHRPRGRSVSQIQDEEIPSIEAQHEYINRVLKWSIADSERFINLLKARVQAEEAYVKHLSNISKIHGIPGSEQCYCFGDKEASFRKAVFQYEASIEHTIRLRRGLIASLNANIDMLTGVKEAQEQRRKTVKTKLGERNQNYINFRTKEIVKLQKAYVNKCTELQNAQHMLQQQQQHGLSAISNYGSDLSLKDGDNPQLSTDEPRPRLSSDSGRDSDSVSSFNATETSLKKNMVNFMNQFAQQARTQLTPNAAQEVSKQNAKCAKLSNEIVAADQEYREGIRVLEKLRREQTTAAEIALRQVEVVFMDKTLAMKNALRDILTKERSVIMDESRLIDYCTRAMEEIDGKSDIYLFNMDYKRRRYITPSPILYDNFYYGKAKDLLFGMSLTEYEAEYGRSVPLLITKCVNAIESMGGLQKEGIYRISGRQSNIEALKSAFEQNEQGLELERTKFDVFTIASVLKIYLRELKEPLLNIPVHIRMEYATAEKQQRLIKLQNKLSSLPKSHRDTLYVLLRHIFRVNQHNQANKMNLQNLSVVFTPAIFQDHNHGEIPGDWRVDSVFEDLVTYHDRLFPNTEQYAGNYQQTYQAVPQTANPSSISGMLLTAPLPPPNLPAMVEAPSTGYENVVKYIPQQRDVPASYPACELPKQQRSASLGNPTTGIPPQMRKVQEHNNNLMPQQPPVTRPQIPPLSNLSSARIVQAATTSEPQSKSQVIPDRNQASMATTLIGMAALSGGLETTGDVADGSIHAPVSHTTRSRSSSTSPAASPTDDVSPTSGRPLSVHSKGVIPPRGDSLRQQIAHQQMLAQQQQQPPPPPPIVTSTPINSKAPPPRQSPSGPLTPTVAVPHMALAHTPSSAEIMINTAFADGDGEEVSSKEEAEKTQEEKEEQRKNTTTTTTTLSRSLHF